VWHRAAPSLPNSQLAEQRQVSSAQHRNGVASNHGPRVHSVKSSAEKTGNSEFIIRRREEQCLGAALSRPWVYSVSDFISI